MSGSVSESFHRDRQEYRDQLRLGLKPFGDIQKPGEGDEIQSVNVSSGPSMLMNYWSNRYYPSVAVCRKTGLRVTVTSRRTQREIKKLLLRYLHSVKEARKRLLPTAQDIGLVRDWDEATLENDDYDGPARKLGNEG